MPRTPKAMKDEDIKPYDREESQASSKSPSKSPRKTSGGDAWTPDQVWALFNQLYKKDKVDWKAISEVVGRNPKSCKNCYEGLFKKRLEGAIKDMVGRGS